MIEFAGKLIALWALVEAWRHRNDPLILRTRMGPGCAIEVDGDARWIGEWIVNLRTGEQMRVVGAHGRVLNVERLAVPA